MAQFFENQLISYMRLLFLSFSLFFSLMCQAQIENNTTEKKENGTVFLIRSTGFTGSAVPFNVFIDDILVCRLMNNYYSAHMIAPGVHKFSVQFTGKKSKNNAEKLEVIIEAEKKYFIQLTFQSGAFANNVYCQEITENSAKQAFKKLRGADSCQ